MEKVILVDENDNELGVMEKMQAHQKALLHRAFSIFIFNTKGELLLQRRALTKYHSPGLWTNTCCSHPRPTEQTIDAAMRRLQEEMGFTCELKLKFNFTYKALLDQGLTEHELDHVYFGNYEGEIKINKEEVAEWKYMSLNEITNDILKKPNDYTVWFKIIINKIRLT